MALLSLSDVLFQTASQAGCRDQSRLRHALDEATDKRLPLIDAVLDANVVDEESFFSSLATHLRLPYSNEDSAEQEGLHNRFPAKLALRHRIYPAHVSAVEATVLTYNPFDLNARQAVGQELQKRVHWQIASRHRILEALHQGYGVGAENFEELLEGRDGGEQDDDMKQEVNVLDEADEEATVMNFVNQVFREALKERATDIHVEPLERDLRIRYRVDGKLIEVPVPPNMRVLQNSLISRLKIMAHLDIAERRMPQDGRINLELDGEPIDVRVATIPSVNGESVALRLLTRKKFDMAAIGLDADTEAKFRKLLAAPNGIILITGPTGSGKSTTLYTLLKELNTKDRRIVTIEDPVENKLDGIIQIAVKPEIDLTFAAGLRSILRGDPNVIMVGEMRDQETVEIAIRGALTGHLVFSTLHTNDAVGGISRLLDMGIEPFMVSSSVRAFQAQRLVRTLCPHCKAPAHHEESFLRACGFPLEWKDKLFHPVGCRSCRNTGFTGRLAIMEICLMTEMLSEKINLRATTMELKAQALKDGMVPMRQYGFRKASQGITTLEEVMTVTAASE
ncbi:GspE/PulE family protein [Prosthecobacter dejongeii]|uniref:General secretion pathway protein E/type IV pilus assembly protein PilB n=1 Tax=Prosthecobacter dejongeii TaxID=48465 RepID=A0A7W7YPP7_9BACT|nr:ATPase, T2SS/T4P/T4SS family [Prosthecobacter dejongeii]MBB5040088.1 general secretion pathway protein E/type IV pilus assembly protein PilB [Prosthecobacter dejongeii]